MRSEHWQTCERCGETMAVAQDPGESLEVWCEHERACEAPGCATAACGDDAPVPCDMCGLNYCKEHLQRVADCDVCAECAKEVID